MQDTEIEFSDSKKSVIISVGVLRRLENVAPEKESTEAGGILLGYTNDEFDYIDMITLPTTEDKRSAFSFLRSRKPAQKAINHSWKKSQGKQIYLGEWHTHPEKEPEPSRRDKSMIREALEKTKMEINHLYLLIYGYENSFWVGRQNSQALSAMKMQG